MSYVKSPVEFGLATDTTGIYVMTEETWIDAMVSTGFLQFGIGDTVEGTIAERQLSLSSSKNVSWQKYLLDTIPEPGYRDHALHEIVRQSIAAQLPRPDSNRHSELFKIAVEKYFIEDFVKSKDFEPIRVWLNEKIRRCAAKLNPDHEKQAVNLRDIQILVIKKVLSALRQNGVVTNFVCELAARIGKTILFLSLAKNMREEFGHESMFIMAYGVGLSVKTSYKDEVSKYVDFADVTFIDAAESDAEQQYQQAIADGKMPVVFISLNPEVEEKYEWINQLQGTHIALLEETDFGTHTDSQVEKVEYILANKTVTRINASGTNIGRLAKAFGKNAIDEIISVPYCMVEQDPSIPNVVVRRFYNMLFNPKMNKLLEDFDKDVLPNINKILEKARSQEKFIAAVFQDLLGYQPIYGMNLSQAAGEIINNLMLFVNISKKAMEALAEIIEKHCAEHKVLILNGDYTDNKEAEGLTKEELVRLQNGYYPGRDKLLVITNMMGTRSYSIPEIQACLFMQEGGDVYPYMQKYSRCLTPGFGKKFGHIFDFAFDQSKTRNTVMSVAVEAALLIRQKGMTYPDAVRTVMNSVNIKDMISGQWIDAEEVINQFEDNNKLLEIANAHTRLTIEDLTSEEIEDLSELAKRSSGSKAEKSKIDKVVATGKTFDSGNTASGRPKKNPLKAIVEKAIRMINGSATTVLALSNYQGESFLECVDIIDADAEMSREFAELYGIKPASIKRLSPRLEISTLDMIVRMSKYNNKQKHIENNALAILKDDTKLWFDIFDNKELKRFIKSKHCKKILVAAGGHGSEIDVLVDMFGVDIVDKIVYNDKYSFFCNQIKRKYPSITVVKGDFTELEFDMKFDVVVGNPPYQGNNDKGTKQPKSHNLWSKFVDKGVELLNTNGYIAFVTPDSWMSPNSQVLKMFKDNSLIWVDTEVGKYFTVGSSFTAWVMQKNKNTSTALIDGLEVDLAKLQYLPRNFSKTFPIHDKVINSAHSKLDILCDTSCHSDHKHKNFSDTKDSTYKYETFHTNAQTKFCKKQSKDFLKSKIIWTTSGYFKPFYSEGHLGTSEVCQYILTNSAESQHILSYLNSKLYKFVVNTGKWSGFLNGKVLSSLPKLASKIWTDAELYTHFGLTQEEIDYIEANVK
jgi:hypothetical protein